MNNKRILLLVYTLLCNILICAESNIKITVWIHGTFPAMTVLTSNHSPFRSWIYTEPSLSLAKNLPSNYYFYKLAKDLFDSDPQEYDINHFYTYGWNSSNVRPGHRHNEGEKLYHALIELLKEYKTKYETISLRIIGFSHGGNIALHCVRCMPFPFDGITTDIILLATPIQESTRDFVNKTCVNKVYSFYSDSDWMQRIDMQKFHRDAPKKCPVWSRRTFYDSDRVVQVRLKINGEFIGHVKYRSIVKYLPNMIKAVEDHIGENKNKADVLLDYKIDKNNKT